MFKNELDIKCKKVSQKGTAYDNLKARTRTLSLDAVSKANVNLSAWKFPLLTSDCCTDEV
jgi:hypothetical protein